MSCCDDIINGVVPAGGAAAQWVCVADINWIEEFDAQGAVDLNASGNTLTDQAGVEWHTPSTGAPFGEPGNQVAAVTSWGLTASGLEIEAAGTAGMDPNLNPVAAQLRTTLAQLAVGYDFEPDPFFPYLFQCYVSAQNGDANFDSSGICIQHLDNIPAGLGAQNSQILAASGFEGVADSARGYGNINATNQNAARTTPTAMNIPTVHYSGIGAACAMLNGFASVDGGGAFVDWPANGDLRAVTSFYIALVTGAMIPEPAAWFVSHFHQSNGLGAAYNAVIQRTRICQFR